MDVVLKLLLEVLVLAVLWYPGSSGPIQQHQRRRREFLENIFNISLKIFIFVPEIFAEVGREHEVDERIGG